MASTIITANIHCFSPFLLCFTFFFVVVLRRKKFVYGKSIPKQGHSGEENKTEKRSYKRKHYSPLSNTYSSLHHSLLSTLSASSRTATRLVLPGWGQLLDAFVIASKTMDAGLYKNETVLRIAVLRVAL